MNKKVFDFEPSSWIPFIDKEVLEKCRNIKREDMEKHPNPDYKIRVVQDPNSIVAAELFTRIQMSSEKGEKFVIIFPNSWRDIYTSVAEMCNRFNVSCHHIHAFCMDEWADDEGNVAPITYGPSLGGAFLREFYGAIREDLRPPIEQMHVFTNENVDCYSDMIEEVGDGGADLCLSATGWIGHTAFIDPDTEEFAADSMEEFLKLGSRFVTQHIITVAQNSTGGEFGFSGDVTITPHNAVTIGPRDIANAKYRLERHNLTQIGGYNSWERMISRLQLYGPVTMKIPATIMQLFKGTVYVSEEMAQPIECQETVLF